MSIVKSDRVLLCVLDGWGVAEDSDYNAITKAKTPCWDYLLKHFPNCNLHASGLEVGVPDGQMGNSEVGHMTMGAGRVLLQDLPKINQAITDNKLGTSAVFNDIVKNNIVHIFGICSDGGVHGHIDHIKYMITIFAKKNNIIMLHLVLDGRDTGPCSGLMFIKDMKNYIKNFTNVEIATISGRYYAMDRDNRWDRTDLVYQAVINGQAERTDNFIKSLEYNYSKDISDEFIKPIISSNYKGLCENSILLITNYRADRVRQIATAFAGANEIYKEKKFKKLYAMGSYSELLDKYYVTIFKRDIYKNSLGEIISNQQWKQIRIAETEKYAHVTYFFNLGIEHPFVMEDRNLIDSPKVKDYKLTPEMASDEITQTVLSAMNEKDYRFILVNYAAPDIIGHTGDLEATIKAVEMIDSCLTNIVKNAMMHNITLIITADHGNCECMYDESQSSVLTSHTMNKVPFILVKNELENVKIKLKNDCGLKDIAPTILEILNLAKPVEMTGESILFEEKREKYERYS